MSRNEGAPDNLKNKQSSRVIAEKLWWFLAVPLFMLLEYQTQIRPAIIQNYNEYICGFVEGGIVMTAFIIIALWINSKV